jgi:hypothetical protein
MSTTVSIVRFTCVAEGKRLRVRIISPGYDPRANVQFPHEYREAGRFYTAPSNKVTFRRGPKHTLFYSVPKSAVTVISNEEERATMIEALRVFEVDPAPECCICMSDDKSVIFIPCGHYCTCGSCAQRLMGTDGSKCPICRSMIVDFALSDELTTTATTTTAT